LCINIKKNIYGNNPNHYEKDSDIHLLSFYTYMIYFYNNSLKSYDIAILKGAHVKKYNKFITIYFFAWQFTEILYNISIKGAHVMK